MVTQIKPPPPQPVAVAEPQPRRFTVAEYYAMAEAGILQKEERVELIDGVVIVMAPMGRPHRATVNRLTPLFVESVGQRAIVQIQSSIVLDDGTMPEPDLVLLRPRADFYESDDPGPDDVLLLIEVSDSTVNYDRNEKLPRYAAAGIPEVWLTVLTERIVEAHTEPVNGRYTVRRVFAPGDTIAPGGFPDVALPVSAILPGQPGEPAP